MDGIDLARYGKSIKYMRAVKGLSQSALSRASGVSCQTIKKQELGQVTPTLDSAYRISRALEVSIDFLICGGGVI